MNAQSLLSLNQRLKLINFLPLRSHDIVFITETWLKPEITGPEFFPMNSPYSISLIVVINLLNRFVMFDVCACMWSAL